MLRSIDNHRLLRTSVRSDITERLLLVVRNCARVLGRTSNDSSTQRSHESGTHSQRHDNDAAQHPSDGPHADAPDIDGGDWCVGSMAQIASYTLPSASGSNGEDDDDEATTPALFFARYHELKKAAAVAADDRPNFETDSDDDDDDDDEGGGGGGDSQLATECVRLFVD